MTYDRFSTTRHMSAFRTFGKRMLAASLLVLCHGAMADTYPSRPVKMIVPFAAGGATDVAARIVAQGMESNLGQPVVVENRPGAAGALAADFVAKASPDGHVLCFCATGPIIIVPKITPNLPYQPARDLLPVSHVLNYENVLIARKGLAANNLAELIKLAKSSSKPLSYATPGSGGTNHLAAEWLQMETGTKLLHIPYKGESAGMTDVVSEQVDLMFASPMLSTPFIKEGKVKAIAMLDQTRSKVLLPNVPTVAESGFPRYAISNFVGIHAPRQTPPAVVARVAQAVAASVKSASVQEKLRSMGLEPFGSSPSEYATFIEKETQVWDRVLANVTITKE